MKELILLATFPIFIFASSVKYTVSYVCYECHSLKMDSVTIGVCQPANSFSESEILSILKNYKTRKKK